MNSLTRISRDKSERRIIEKKAKNDGNGTLLIVKMNIDAAKIQSNHREDPTK